MVLVKLRVRKLGGLGGAGEVIEVDNEGEAGSLIDKLAKQAGVAAGRIKLAYKGKALRRFDKLDCLDDNDVLSYAVTLQAPDESLRATTDDGFEEREARDLRFDIESLPRGQQKAALFLKHKLGLPDLALIVIFSISPRAYLVFLMWAAGSQVAARYQLGPTYIILTVIALILLNLGTRREGESSAYSVFNNFRALPGQLTPEMFEREIRRGQM